MGSAEALVAVQATGGTVGELGPRPKVILAAEGGVWGGEVSRPSLSLGVLCSSLYMMFFSGPENTNSSAGAGCLVIFVEESFARVEVSLQGYVCVIEIVKLLGGAACTALFAYLSVCVFFILFFSLNYYPPTS